MRSSKWHCNLQSNTSHRETTHLDTATIKCMLSSREHWQNLLTNGAVLCWPKVISVTWSWSSSTPWVRLCASAPSTSWRAWMRNTGTDCASTSAKLTRPAGNRTDRYRSHWKFWSKSSTTSKPIFFFKTVSQRVMMQIVQELCKRPGLNKCGFDMPTIYIPNPTKVRVLLSCSSSSLQRHVPL